jgi:transcription antitermination factor NusG
MDFRHWYALFVMMGQEDGIRRHIEYALSRSKTVTARVFVPKRRLKSARAAFPSRCAN